MESPPRWSRWSGRDPCGAAGRRGRDCLRRSLPDDVPATANLDFYAGIVRDRAIERRLLTGVQEIAEEVHAGQEVSELLELAESTIFRVTQERNSADWQVMSTVLDEEFLRIQKPRRTAVR